MITDIKNLKDLYRELLDDIKNYKKEIAPFFIQVGKKYVSAPNRLMFVGKATNGWVTKCRDVDELFDLGNPDRIVNRDDQLEWIKSLEGPNPQYNTNKSAFWRVFKQVSSNIIEKDDWYNYVAWSNLFKIAPWEGKNPDSKLKEMQISTCANILCEEIRILKPTVIVFFTSGWEKNFLIKYNLNLTNNKSTQWKGSSKSFTINFQDFNDTIYVQTVHPQGKKEQPHIEALTKVIQDSLK